MTTAAKSRDYSRPLPEPWSPVQFSLRGVIVVMTVLAVQLGAVSPWLRNADDPLLRWFIALAFMYVLGVGLGVVLSWPIGYFVLQRHRRRLGPLWHLGSPVVFVDPTITALMIVSVAITFSQPYLSFMLFARSGMHFHAIDLVVVAANFALVWMMCKRAFDSEFREQGLFAQESLWRGPRVFLWSEIARLHWTHEEPRCLFVIHQGVPVEVAAFPAAEVPEVDAWLKRQLEHAHAGKEDPVGPAA